MVALFPSSVFKKEKKGDIRCGTGRADKHEVFLLCHGDTHMPLQRIAWSALTCFRVPRCESAQPDLHGEMPACPWPK